MTIENVTRIVQYRGLKADCIALTAGLEEGALAYATDTSQLGIYTNGAWIWFGLGTGDVVGPAGATADDIVLFDGATGKLIKDGGHKLSEYILDPATPEQGDILYWNGSAWVRLAHGTSTQFLKSGGHAANPEWDIPSVPGGGGGASTAIGLNRWLSDGGTTFTLPDVAEYVFSVSDNGAVVDPNTYTLSADHSQIIFDSAITAAHVITTEYVIAQI